MKVREYKNTMNKMVVRHFRVFTRMPFVYRRKRYEPTPLRLSTSIFRKYSCKNEYSVYCLAKTLDYLPKEKISLPVIRKSIKIDGTPVKIKTVPVTHEDPFCKYLNKKKGICNIPKQRPLFCKLHPLNVFVGSESGKLNILMGTPSPQRLARYTLDGRQGAIFTEEHNFDMRVHKLEIIRKLVMLQKFMKHFKLPTKVTPIIEWVLSGPHKYNTTIL